MANLNNILQVRAEGGQLAVPMLHGTITNQDVFDFQKSDFEDDCLARRSSRLSLMSKHLLGLADEVVDF